MAGSAPRLVKAEEAEVAPVPPLVMAMVLPFQVPEEMVPTAVSEELTTFAASVVPVKVPASEDPDPVPVMVISAEPSNATPLIDRAVASLVAVAAFPLILPAMALLMAVWVADETGLLASEVLSTFVSPIADLSSV